ncbi:MAG: GDP-mannose 4,6-dehydratase [Acidimicrobiales bacterium]
MRALVVGSSGFVGTYLVQHLRAMGDDVVTLDDKLDITDRNELWRNLSAVGDLDVVFHLAAQSDVGRSWTESQLTYNVNILGTANLCDAIVELSPRARFVFISSSEVYGAPLSGELPLKESSPLRPVTPYAASKAAAEMICRQAHFGSGLDVVIARSFNHTGPGQRSDFVVSGLAQRVAHALLLNPERGVVRVGTMSSRRDFTDVRDVVRAYRLLGTEALTGDTFNVCSGRSHAISEIAEILSRSAAGEVAFEVDQALVRPVEVEEVVGSFELLNRQTGWRPEITFEATVQSLLQHWQAVLESE